MKLKICIALALLGGMAAAAQGPAYPYSVALSFTASTGTVTGYNMYRAPYASGACGTYAKLNSTPFTATSYTDTTPAQGAYCYAATAVDGTSESGLSNIDSDIVIPPPPPTGLGATVAQVAGQNEIELSWNLSTGTGITAEWAGCSTSLPITSWHQLSGPTVTSWVYVPPVQTGLHYCSVYSVSSGVKSGTAAPVSVNLS
jgi:hypothetical protein